MKNKFKKIVCGTLALLMILSTAAISLTGCSKTEEEEIVYELVPVLEDSLEVGNYYVKNGDNFYKLPDTSQKASFGNDLLIAKNATPERTLLFEKDDVFIPTLYKDDMLIYVTDQKIPSSFVWERYEDNGYTIGITGLRQNEAGRYSASRNEANVRMDSTFGSVLSGLTDDEIIIIDKIDNKSVNNTIVSSGGSITGLTYGNEYNVDTYVGSEYIEAKVIADTHAFTSFEIYETTTYDFAKSNYIILTIPEYFMSGYYLVNGSGFVKYADVERKAGISGINFNSPYYLGVDEFGNQITADTQINAETGESDIERNIYKHNFTIDCTNEKMTVRIKYSDVFDKVNGIELNLSNAIKESLSQTALIATLKGPDEKEYQFEPSYETENELECVVRMPLSGTWTVELQGFDLRTYEVSTTLVSGHSDSMLHTGSGKASMSHYLNNSLENMLLTITWANSSRAATIEIETPDGRKITKTQNEDLFKEEGYGYAKVLVPNAAYGSYKITIDGEDLGRVRINSLDYNQITLIGQDEVLIENNANE